MLLLKFIVLTISFEAIAGLSCSQNGTTVYYVNGVNVKYDEGEKDTDYLNGNFVNSEKNRIDFQSIVETKFIYNSSRGLLNDVKEIYYQATRNLSGEQRKYFYRRKLEKLIEKSYKDESSDLADTEKKKLEEMSKEAFSLIMKRDQLQEPISSKEFSELEITKMISKIDYEIAELLRTATADTEVVESIKNRLKEAFSLRKKIITIAHSQGNEALRSAIYELRSEMSGSQSLNQLYEFDRIFGIVHVASPSPVLAISSGKARAIKLNRDFVIRPAGILLPENPIEPNYIYESSNLSGVGDWPIVGSIAEFFTATFGGNLYHGMSYIYLSEKVNASEVGNPTKIDTMSNIFKNNLIEVAQTLEDNCSEPVIKITSVTAEETASGIITVNDYAGAGKVLRLEVSDIAGNGNSQNQLGYDASKTTFQYKLITRYPIGVAGEVSTVEDTVDMQSGKYYIDIPIPYRDFQYDLTITATNIQSKETEKSYKLVFSKNKVLSVDISNKQCVYNSDGYNLNGTMKFDIKTNDDEYKFDNKSWSSSTEERVLDQEFKDSENIVTKKIENICPIETPAFHYEIWVSCQTTGKYLSDGTYFEYNTGLQGTDVYWYNDKGSLVSRISGFEGTYEHSTTSSFVDKNDPSGTTKIEFENGTRCPTGEAANPTRPFKY
ncbi:hypothetical protein DOM21_16565 [Bacteriovorax stolpii]|nr:hypothetical protein DOM21_16565 [Bacteriovorax stolpii]